MTSTCRLIRASYLLKGLRGTYKPASAVPNSLYLSRRFASSTSSSTTTTPVSNSPKIADTPTPTNTPTTTTTTDTTDTSNLSFSLPDNIRWESTSEVATSNVDLFGNHATEITGAIIPFAQQNFLQNIFFPYQYPIMYYMDFLVSHTPWWASIIATTATVRLFFFPLVVKMNIIGIKIYNIMPETQALQVKLNEAMLSGDAYQSAITKTKIKMLYEQHDVRVIQRLVPTLIQSPAFLCLFFTLKNLAGYYKLPALATGGALWFTNLTVPDPFFILPAMTSLSMFLLLEYGLEGSSGPIKTMGPVGRWMIRAIPVGLFFIFQNFPSAVLLFWTTNNFITLSYSLLLKNPWIKKKFKIPERLNHDPASLPLTNQSFMGQLSKGVDKAKGSRTSLDLRKLDDIAFQKAGVGPLRKTYKNPPKKEDSL